MKAILAASIVLTLTACGGDSASSDTCKPGSATALNTVACDPGFTQTKPNKPGTVQVTFSGETFGVNGLPFQPVHAGDPVFVDGWTVSFDEILVVLGNFRLSENATASADWKQVGPSVATKKGPYVVDMHKPSGFVGSDGESPAGALFKWDGRDDGKAFDTSIRYAFSYDVQKAVYPATQLNLTPGQFADYDLMVQKGWSKLYRGTATFVGTGVHPTPAVQAKFAALPKTVKFVFGFNDAGGLVNCVNPDNGAGDGAGHDLGNRGINTNSNGATTAQVTLHVDHAFWDAVKIEGTPLRFDPVAAWATSANSTTPLNLNALATRPLSTTFADGTPLPDRGPFMNVPGGYTSNQSNPDQIVLDLNGVPSSTVRGLADFMAFSAQSQMHLNADGLCYVVGQSAADPFYTPNVQP